MSLERAGQQARVVGLREPVSEWLVAAETRLRTPIAVQYCLDLLKIPGHLLCSLYDPQETSDEQLLWHSPSV